MQGIMRNSVSLVGVRGMELTKGEKVVLTLATNLPVEESAHWLRYFARPANQQWSDGVERNDDDSILIDSGDVRIDWSDYDRVGAIIEFESGELSDLATLQLFQNLVDTGLAWSLQGSYGRMATALIERGKIFAERAPAG